MYYRISACLLALLWVGSVWAQRFKPAVIDTLSQRRIVERYTQALQKRVQEQDSLLALPAVDDHLPHPYYYRLFAPATLYRSPLSQAMGIDWSLSRWGERQASSLLQVPVNGELCLDRAINEVLNRTYVSAPQLVAYTEVDLEQAGTLRDDLAAPIHEEVRIIEKTEEAELDADVGAVAVVVKKPNFWRFFGTTSMQFMQSYYSDNWYQGGEENYSMLAQVRLNANYDNKQKIQWENKLDVDLGFQTNKSDKEHQLKTTSDLLRLTSKIGYRASKHWFYTVSVEGKTQMLPKYQNNSNTVVSDFTSPFNMVLSVGMDFKLNLKNFTGSAEFAPVAYNFRYVAREELYTRHGNKERHSTHNDFGPNIKVNYTWNICKNISWVSRFYWFSNLEMTNIEWENTFNFTVNKYLTCRLFAYPKIDDSSKRYKSEDMDKYFMFKEWLSLGVNYSF